MREASVHGAAQQLRRQTAGGLVCSPSGGRTIRVEDANAWWAATTRRAALGLVAAALRRPAARLSCLTLPCLLPLHQSKPVAIDNIICALFKRTFVPRYRDISSDIRVICVAELGCWIKLYPDLFLDNNYLKYIGWMLYDKVGALRWSAASAEEAPRPAFLSGGSRSEHACPARCLVSPAVQRSLSDKLRFCSRGSGPQGLTCPLEKWGRGPASCLSCDTGLCVWAPH
ncbi:uncharacterized protein LOC121024238 [Herpailurus yagouaroundi]|uniref:uncharacterized protein LOC121024238 n=1 Tax=Herpailurus yagouaroundi TaxID=1608482 RepID=UPI001AD6C2A0|nr:uncharacterized protein LOC121024238 [Puma yagouaroundi]